MALTSAQRKEHTLPAQSEVALGAAEGLAAEGHGTFTTEQMAEALTMAQEYLHPSDRIKTPVNGAVAGQYLGWLASHGYVEKIGSQRGQRRNFRGRKTRTTTWLLTGKGLVALAPTTTTPEKGQTWIT